MMACFKRMIQSGIRLSKLGSINDSADGSMINRLVASTPKSYRSFCLNSSRYRRLHYGQISRNGNSCCSLCSNSSGCNKLDYRRISPNGKLVYAADTLHLISRLEAKGMPSKDAEEAKTSNFNSKVESSQMHDELLAITNKQMAESNITVEEYLHWIIKLHSDNVKKHGKELHGSTHPFVFVVLVLLATFASMVSLTMIWIQMMKLEEEGKWVEEVKKWEEEGNLSN